MSGYIDKFSGINTTGRQWDGMNELDNPLPKWWIWLFSITIIWGLGYIAAYPALPWFEGAAPSLSGWSSHGQLAAESKAVARAKEELRDVGLAAIRYDPRKLKIALAAGQAAFGDQCAPCHGGRAGGSKGYPALNDTDWLWGGTLSAIEETIRVGVRSGHEETRIGDMPAYGKDKILDAEQIRDVAGYTLSLSGLAADNAGLAKGKEIFAKQCTACHGEEGQGNDKLGAPNLADDIWLFGQAAADVTASIARSRKGVMPAWSARLDAATLKGLAIYVHSLGGGQ